MSQNLKLERCPQEKCIDCNVYQLAQRRIVRRGLIDPNSVASALESERCPTGAVMVTPRGAQLKEPNIW
jgi:hypothetical protein